MVKELAKPDATSQAKDDSVQWFEWLQQHICTSLETIEREYAAAMGVETTQRFRFKSWKREDASVDSDGGGGTMGLLQNGGVFEKAGVNISCVHGQFSQTFQNEMPGADQDSSFWAAGISLVIHPLNPHVPAVHMNTRHIVTTKSWVGGGADLTPTIACPRTANDFHMAFQQACDRYAPDAYQKFKLWCDEYFYLSHRNEGRGIGGIFFDYLNSGSHERDFAFIKDVGMCLEAVYASIVRQTMYQQWTHANKQQQLEKRGRYVEFNLLYDRGTRFGLMTQGNIDAILMSLPPTASWKAGWYDAS